MGLPSLRNLVIDKLWACKLLLKGPHLLNSPPNAFCFGELRARLCCLLKCLDVVVVSAIQHAEA